MHAFLTKEFRLEYFLSSITVLKKPKMANEGKRMQKNHYIMAVKPMTTQSSRLPYKGSNLNPNNLIFTGTTFSN